MRERKSGAVTIKQVVIRISSVTIRWKKREKKKMGGRKNGVACTIAPIILTKNVSSREARVTVWTVMEELAEKMKPSL